RRANAHDGIHGPRAHRRVREGAGRRLPRLRAPGRTRTGTAGRGVESRRWRGGAGSRGRARDAGTAGRDPETRRAVLGGHGHRPGVERRPFAAPVVPDLRFEAALSRPELLRFRERLSAALASATRGALASRDYEALLVDPDFDADEFDRFRQEALRRGIALPEEEVEATAEVRPLPGEPERDLLDLYLNEIGRIPMLPHERLLETARRARAGDEQARKQVIVANLRLVVHLARQYRNRGLPMLDLIEEGNLGLIHAVDRFEPERGLRFSTYAAIWIRQAMLRGIAEQARSVRIPVQMFQQVNRFLRTERVLRGRLARDPSLDEIAQELQISPVRVERLAGLVSGLRSLDESSGL